MASFLKLILTKLNLARTTSNTKKKIKKKLASFPQIRWGRRSVCVVCLQLSTSIKLKLASFPQIPPCLLETDQEVDFEPLAA